MIEVKIAHRFRLSPPEYDCSWKIQKLSTPSPEIHTSTPHHLQNHKREVGDMRVRGVEMISYWFITVVFDVKAMPIQTNVEKILGLTNGL